MRILVYEHVTGGGGVQAPLSASLAAEGDAMLRALSDDLARLPEHDIRVTRDDRLPALNPAIAELRVRRADEFEQVWAREIAAADAVWPIAPETDGALASVTEAIQHAGRVLLNSRLGAVRIAASKHATASRLRAAGIPVVPTRWLAEAATDWTGPVVVKPDDGAGCEGIRLFSDLATARAWGSRAGRGWVVQPFITGVDASLSVLCGEVGTTLLSVNRQIVAREGDRLRLLRCEPAAFRDRDGALRDLAEQVVAAVPGCRGYLGIDILLTADGPRVVEVNPRVTSAYVGLSAALGFNVAGAVLAAVTAPDCA